MWFERNRKRPRQSLLAREHRETDPRLDDAATPYLFHWGSLMRGRLCKCSYPTSGDDEDKSKGAKINLGRTGHPDRQVSRCGGECEREE